MNILTRTFMPPMPSTLISSVGDVQKSRDRFLATKSSNLRFLLEQRYEWMNRYIGEGHRGVEVGSGAGFSREFIKNRNYELTDCADFEWLDRNVDATCLPYASQSLDFMLESNVLHHLASPARFLNEAHRVLKPGGFLLIQDVWGSLLLRLLCRIFKTEGYSYDVDVFDQQALCCDPNNAWAGNNVVPNLLFADRERFERAFGFEIAFFRHCEVMLFPLSGGVTSHLRVPRLPVAVLSLVERLDDLLAKMSPSVFALQVQVALRKPDAR
jgi:SAM-dependent methyltransferase